MELDKICRLCLSQSVVCYSLLEEDARKMMESLTQIKPTGNEYYPKIACVKCWLNIKLAYNIQQGIMESYRKLQLVDICDTDAEYTEIKEEDSNDSIQEAGSDMEEVLEEDGELKQVVLHLDQPEQNTCTICGEEVVESDFTKHVQEHFNTKQVCADCDQVFDNIHIYRTHVLKEHGKTQRILTCELCGVSFRYKSLYKIHIDKAHAVTTLDDEVHFFESSFKDEPSEINTTEEKSFQIMRLGLTTKKAIESLDAPLEVVGDFQCMQCFKRFIRESQYLSHVENHKRKKCHICNAEITRCNFKKHVMMHTDSPTVCHLCGATCKNGDSLRGHLYYTHSEKQFPCEHCGKCFKKSYSRVMHIKKEHTGEKNHVCETCGKAFFTLYCLRKHVKMTHLKLRPYICSYCKKGFSSKFALRTHERQHTNDAPYKCDLCGEGFRQNVSLRAHKKSKHHIIESNNCFCKICGKAFHSDWAVKSHMRLH